jgi:L-lactate dehydrogenase complex protein LldF
MDNGRSQMLAHPVTRQGLACIRCGACLNACPVYQQIGGHAYGSVYPGPIGAVITPQLVGLGKAKQLPYASSLCGACREVCPVKIDIPAMLLHLRSQIVDGSDNTGPNAKPEWRERLAFRAFGVAWRSSFFYQLSNRLGKLMQGVFMSRGRIRRFARTFSTTVQPIVAWTNERDAPQVAEISFRQIWETELKENKRD